MNKRKRPISAGSERRMVRTDEVPLPPGSRRFEGAPSLPAHTNSMIVFCGDAQLVSEGFAIALNAMEANAEMLMMATEPVSEEELNSYVRSGGNLRGNARPKRA